MSTTGKTVKKLLVLLVIFVTIGFFVRWGVRSVFTPEEPQKLTNKNSILKLELNGVILSGKKFIKSMDKYGNDDKVKAILVSINSPGGAVGPSQEIYQELKNLKDKTSKPVVCVSTNLLASGAYYVAAACDKIVVAPGALVGSIGVIMEFINLEKLYDWAKVNRFSIASGKFKDSGAEYRPMRDDEKALFQELIADVYQQFRLAVAKDRKLDDSVMDQYADGRVFSGEKAVKLGFADQVGTVSDAAKLAAEIANLGSNYEIFEIPKKHRTIFDLGTDDEDELFNSADGVAEKLGSLGVKSSMLDGLTQKTLETIFKVNMANQPMLIMPGFWN